MIGSIISHYKILEKLGSGGMGVVYKAQDLKLDRFVALKFLPPSFSNDEEAKQRFIHEAKSASSLEHPNICNIHEIGETEGDQLFIVMAYYEGETLKKKIDKGSLKVEDAIDITIQIAEGLQAAHNKGIVHRDIKPANIFIRNDGTVKILDFGLAKSASRNTMTQLGSTMGTVAYMSPEQTHGTDVDHRTDIWSLGVILYEMITGQLPFKGDYEQAVIYN
ncbi:MAG: serine/threonine-protein kinase, partial [Bacteroidota bacterium]